MFAVITLIIFLRELLSAYKQKVIDRKRREIVITDYRALLPFLYTLTSGKGVLKEAYSLYTVSCRFSEFPYICGLIARFFPGVFLSQPKQESRLYLLACSILRSPGIVRKPNSLNSAVRLSVESSRFIL